MLERNSHSNEKSEINLVGFGGGTRLIGLRCDLRWVVEFFSPSLRSVPQASTTETVHAEIDSRQHGELRRVLEQGQVRRYDCFSLDGHFESFLGCEMKSGSLVVWLESFSLMLLVDQARENFRLIADSPASRMRIGMMRVLREIATVRALRSGALPLHGSACVKDGKTIGFLGAKTAGKTTSLIHWLQSPGVRFLANDRFFVAQSNASWSASGMPTIVNVRAGTLQHFDLVRQRAVEMSYHLGRTIEESQSDACQSSRSDEAVSINQAQFLRILDRSAVSEAPLGLFLFPERDDRVETAEYEPLAFDEGVQLLSANLFVPGQRISTSEVFDREPEHEICIESVQAMCRKLSAAGFCYRYRQGYRTLSHQPVSPLHSKSA